MMKRSFLSLVSMAFIAAMTLTGCEEMMSAIDNPVDSYLEVDGPELYVAEGSSIDVACATISDGEVTFTVADAKVAKVEKAEPHMAKVTGLKVGETDVIVKLAATEYYKAAEAKVKIIVKPTYSLKDAVVDGAKLKIGYKLNNEDCEFVYEFDGEKKVFNWLPANSAVPQAMDAYDITMTYDGETTITHKVVTKDDYKTELLVLNLYTSDTFDRIFRAVNEMKSVQVNGYEMLPYVPESVTPVFNITIAPTPDPKVGEKVLLSAGILPGNATNQVLKWSTSDPTKATIDEDGVLTALAVGKVTIKCEATDGSGKFDEKEITVEEAGPSLSTPLTFEVLTDGTIAVAKPRAGMQYKKSTDEIKTSLSGDLATINVSKGDKVEFYGTATTYYAGGSDRTQFGGTAEVNVYGNIMSLLYADFADKKSLPAAYTFMQLFASYTALKDASGLLLPAETLTDHCYQSMFSSCSSLTTAPKLPATTLPNNCYYSMFKNCTNLTNAYVKAAYVNSLANPACYDMFKGCTATGAKLHTTSDNKASWDIMMAPSKLWPTWTAVADWTD